MTGPGKVLGVLLGSVVATAVGAQPPTQPLVTTAGMASMPAAPSSPATMGSPAPARVSLADVVEPGYREAVLKVARQPTIGTRAMSEELVCDPELYGWLLEHPDRVSLAWRRLKVNCVEITDLGNGRFAWADGEGSELVWEAVGRFTDGLVWYATGKVKPNAVTPVIPVRAVVVVHHPRRALNNGKSSVAPVVQAYVHTESRTANTILRILGPTAPKLAQQGADQLLFFFNGIARYIQSHPDQADTLLAPSRK